MTRLEFEAILRKVLLTVIGLGLYLAWIPDERVWWSISLVLLATVAAWTGWWLSRGRQAGIPWRTHPVLWVVFGMAGVGAFQVGAGWSVYPWWTTREVFRWLSYGAIVLLALQLFRESRAREQFRSLTVLFCLILTLISIVQYLSYFNGVHRIFGLFLEVPMPMLGPFLNYDHFATFVALVMPIALYQGSHRGIAWLPLVTAAAMYSAVVAGQSRAGTVNVTLEIVVVFLLMRRQNKSLPGRQLGFAAAALAVVAALFVSVVGWQPLLKRFSTDSDLLRNERREFHAASFKMVKTRPLKGFGLGTWAALYPEFTDYDSGNEIVAAHGDWWQWTVEGGFPALLLMGTIGVYSLFFAWRQPYTAGLTFALVHCLVEYPLQRPFVTAVFFLCLGVAAASAVRQPEELPA